MVAVDVGQGTLAADGRSRGGEKPTTKTKLCKIHRSGDSSFVEKKFLFQPANVVLVPGAKCVFPGFTKVRPLMNFL